MAEEERDVKRRKDKKEQHNDEKHVVLAQMGSTVGEHGVHAHPEGHQIEAWKTAWPVRYYSTRVYVERGALAIEEALEEEGDDLGHIYGEVVRHGS